MEYLRRLEGPDDHQIIVAQLRQADALKHKIPINIDLEDLIQQNCTVKEDEIVERESVRPVQELVVSDDFLSEEFSSDGD